MATTNQVTNIISNFITKGLDKATNGYKKAQEKLQLYSDKISKNSGLTAKENNKIAKSFIDSTAKQNAASNAYTKKQKTVNDLMQKTGLSANKLARGIRSAGYKISDTGKITDSFGKSVKLGRKELNEITKSSRRFNMANLSGLFGMMALQRATKGFLTSAVNTYNKANEQGGEFTRQTNKMSAAFGFFKYSLLDALSKSDLFNFLIEKIVNITNWFNSLNEKQKGLMGFILIFVLIASTIGMALFQMSLFIGSFGLLSVKAFTVLGGIILLIAGIAFIISGVVDAVRFWGKDTQEVVSGIVKIILGLGLVIAGIAFLIGSVTVGVIALIVAAIAAMVLIIVKNWDKVLEYNAYMAAGLKSAWVAVKYFFIDVVDKIVVYFGEKITKMMERAARLADALGFSGVADKIRSGMQKIQDATTSNANKIQADKQAELDAIQDVLNAKLKSIRDAEAAREAAVAKEKETNLFSIDNMKDKLGLSDLVSIYGNNSTKNTPTTSLKTSQNSIFNNMENIFNIDGSSNDPTLIADEVIEKINAKYGMSVGSSNT